MLADRGLTPRVRRPAALVRLAHRRRRLYLEQPERSAVRPRPFVPHDRRRPRTRHDEHRPVARSRRLVHPRIEERPHGLRSHSRRRERDAGVRSRVPDLDRAEAERTDRPRLRADDRPRAGALAYRSVDPSRVSGLIETAHAMLAGLDPSDEMAFALAHDKLASVHLNDQNGLKYDQDKCFGSANLAGGVQSGSRPRRERLRPPRRVRRPRRARRFARRSKTSRRPTW